MGKKRVPIDDRELVLEANVILQELEQYDCMFRTHDDSNVSIKDYFYRIKDESGLEFAINAMLNLYEKILVVKEEILNDLN